jgi:hypothetical protein
MAEGGSWAEKDSPPAASCRLVHNSSICRFSLFSFLSCILLLFFSLFFFQRFDDLIVFLVPRLHGSSLMFREPFKGHRTKNLTACVRCPDPVSHPQGSRGDGFSLCSPLSLIYIPIRREGPLTAYKFLPKFHPMYSKGGQLSVCI